MGLVYSGQISMGSIVTEMTNGYTSTTSTNGLTNIATTIHQNGTADDAFVTIPLFFNITFNGIQYNTVYVCSNSYITFGSGRTSISPLNYGNVPDVPTIKLSAADNSYQKVTSGTPYGVGTKTIRYEGTNATFGVVGSPNIVWEVTFYQNSSNINLAWGQNSRNYAGSGGLTNGIYLLTSENSIFLSSFSSYLIYPATIANVSLRSLSFRAFKQTQDAISEFYGFPSNITLLDYYNNNTTTTSTTTSTTTTAAPATRTAYYIDTTNSGTTGKYASYIFQNYDLNTGIYQNDARFVFLYSSNGLVIGSILYNASTGGTVFNGNSLWYQKQGGTNPIIYQISTSGAILAIYNSVYESPNVLPTAPTAFAGVKIGTGASRSFQFSWTVSSDNDMVHHYNLYFYEVGGRTTTSYHLVPARGLVPTVSGTTRTITISPVPSFGGAPMSWWVTSNDISGNESDASNTYYDSTGGTW